MAAKKIKSPLVYLAPLPLLAQEKASPVHGSGCSVLAVTVLNSSCLQPPFPSPGKGGWVDGMKQKVSRTQFLVLATAVPLAWEGRLCAIDGIRTVFVMIIYPISVSNSTSTALGREKAVSGTACV